MEDYWEFDVDQEFRRKKGTTKHWGSYGFDLGYDAKSGYYQSYSDKRSNFYLPVMSRANNEHFLVSLYFEDRATFLSKLWSNGKVKSVNIKENGEELSAKTDMEKNQIYISTPVEIIRFLSASDLTSIGHPITLGSKKSIAIWRMLRFSLWHENMHLLFTPKHWNYTCENDNIDKSVYNILEDAKVNDLGEDLYPGMSREEEVVNKMTLYSYNNGDILEGKDRYERLLLNLGISILCRGKPKFKDDIERDIVEYAKKRYEEIMTEYAKTKRLSTLNWNIFTLAKELSVKVSNAKMEVDDDEGDVDGGNGEEDVPKNDWTFNYSDMERFLEMVRYVSVASSSAEMNKLVDEIEKTCPAEIIGEISELKNIEEMMSGNANIQLSANSEDQPMNFIDRELVIRMMAALRKWKDSYERTYNEAGMDLDMEKCILNELKSSPVDDFYISDERILPRDKILFVIDMSGSMASYITDFKKALFTLTTCLDNMKLDYAISYFINTSSTALSCIKPFKKRMSWLEKTFVSQMVPDGGTPLGKVLSEMMGITSEFHLSQTAVSLFKESQFIIFLHDGGPTDSGRFISNMKLLRETKKPFYFLGIYPTDSNVVGSVEFEDGYQKMEVREDERAIVALEDLPKVATNLIMRTRVI